MRQRALASAARVLGTVAAVVSVVGCLIGQPTFRKSSASPAAVDPQRLKAHVVACRNKAYHTVEDTADRLDYVRMSKVVVSVFEAIRTP